MQDRIMLESAGREKMRERLLAAINSYNIHRTPLASAKLVEADKRKIAVDFSGPFCTGCSPLSYINDFIVEAKQNGLSIEIETIENRGNYIRIKFSSKSA